VVEDFLFTGRGEYVWPDYGGFRLNSPHGKIANNTEAETIASSGTSAASSCIHFYSTALEMLPRNLFYCRPSGWYSCMSEGQAWRSYS
jgi:hypothetical protein